MGAIASQITSFTIVYSTVYSNADERKHQSSASLAFVWGILGGPVNSPHKWPVTRKMFPFDDVIMFLSPTTGIFVIVYAKSTMRLWDIYGNRQVLVFCSNCHCSNAVSFVPATALSRAGGNHDMTQWSPSSLVHKNITKHQLLIFVSSVAFQLTHVPL